MGDLLSLFWEVDPPPMPLSFTIPSQDYECRKDDSCGAIGSFLLWYFVIILALMFFSRASIWMSEKKKDEDSGTSTSVSKESKNTSSKGHNKDSDQDSLPMTKEPRQSPLNRVTDSEVTLGNAYLAQRRARRHSEVSQAMRTQDDSDTTECDSEESNSGASSWKESESEHPSLASGKERKIARGQKNVGSYQIRERPCLHCKALRTNEWLTRHFLENASEAAPMKREIQEENSVPDVKTKFSKL